MSRSHSQGRFQKLTCLRSKFPTRREARWAVPLPAELSNDILIQPDKFAVLKVTVEVIRGRFLQLALGAKRHSAFMKESCDQRSSRAVHSGNASDGCWIVTGGGGMTMGIQVLSSFDIRRFHVV